MALSDYQREALDWALGRITAARPDYMLFRQYYAGDQTPMMSESRLAKMFGDLFDEFALNLCQPVVDSLADRLSVSSFSTGADAGDDEQALEVWKRNRMRRRAGQVHMEAIATGDAYVIVWPDENQNATIYPQAPETVTVEYDEGTPGHILRAAKLWSDKERRDRLTLYYPDRIERFATPPKATQWDSTSGAYTPYTAPGEKPIVPNPYGVVPVFHFANNADLGAFGVSELYNAVPVQNALNYEAFHLLVNTEHQGFRQRWATGIEIQRDADGNPINPFRAGAETVWVAGATDDKEARFGEFEAANLDPMQNAMKTWALFMAQVTQTPPHYFFSTSQMVSGESQKTAEQKLDAKVKDRQEAFGDTWAAAVALAVRMESGLASDGLELDTNWADTKPRNEKESWEVAGMKAALGVSKEQILREMGYTDEQIEKFREEDGGPGRAPGSVLDGFLSGRNGNPLTNGA